MKLRAQQIEVLDRLAVESFHVRVSTYLREQLPDRTANIPEHALRKRIAACRAAAETYGVVGERAVAKWCFLSVVAGDEFHRNPDIQVYLKADHPDPDAKVDCLMDALYVRLKQAETDRER